ncbi:hypothetical protein [Mycolicibacterium llatzerense]|uniref:hypothetical protein n=1 Tax=Mycolicibacterium llatzerense TaxID=280871 RepID=UPI0008DD5DF9|nr:hypothetical protein [Mycolicibacterium llatzerense]
MTEPMATLFAPKVGFTSTGESQFGAMMTWRAELELGYLDDEEWDTPQVVAGHAEFLIINVGEHPIGDLLDSLSQDAMAFAGLFEGVDVAQEVQDQFDDAWFNRVLIVTLVDVAAPLRGHDLGAWLVAEIVARMAGATDTLVLLYPHPVGRKTNDVAGARALSTYWQRVGLVPVRHQPHFLCAATAHIHLSNAREALRHVDDVQIAVPRSLICDEAPSVFSRHMIASVAQPRGLRLVSD